MSEMGPKILVDTKFIGLSGQFQLENRESKSLAFEIFNVIDKNEIVIGNWTQNRGLSLDMKGDNTANSNQPCPPGITTRLQKKLKIGGPKENGFTEFVSHVDGSFSGFSIEVFCEVYKVLEDPFLFEFIPYNRTETTDGSYDNLLYKIKNGVSLYSIRYDLLHFHGSVLILLFYSSSNI